PDCRAFAVVRGQNAGRKLPGGAGEAVRLLGRGERLAGRRQRRQRIARARGIREGESQDRGGKGPFHEATMPQTSLKASLRIWQTALRKTKAAASFDAAALEP